MSSTQDDNGKGQIHFTLLENGLDFIWSAVEHLSTAASKRELKYASLHLVSGIELVLKERLRREDWKLLFPDPDKASEAKYISGNFVSVNFDALIDRVDGWCIPGFTKDEELALRTVRRQRNRFEHSAANESAAAVIASTAVALGVILDFIRKELSGDDNGFTVEEQVLLTKIRGKLAELDTFVQTRLKSIAPDLEEAYAALPCPACQQDALTIDDGVECLFCGYKTDADTAADEYVTSIMGLDRFRFEKDGGVWPVSFCPSCHWETCVDANLEGYMCFGCGSRWELGGLDTCGRCGRWMEKSDIFICGSCFEEQVRRDD